MDNSTDMYSLYLHVILQRYKDCWDFPIHKKGALPFMHSSNALPQAYGNT